MFRRIKNNRKGSVLIEATIVIPIFIISMVSVLFCMRTICQQETVVHVSCNQALKHSVNSAIMPVNPMFPYNLKIEIENNIDESCEVEVNNFFTKYEIGYINDLNSFTVSLRSNSNILSMIDNKDISRHHLIYRSFCGKDNSINPYEFDFASDKTVYVMPRRGERYHNKYCAHVTPYPIRTRMSDRIRSLYGQCQTCDPGKVKNGAIIYYFREGEVYHKANCITVEKYVVKMTKAEAVAEGYSVCTQCGGIL